MNAASDDLAGVLPPVKPWEQRSNGVLPLAGGNAMFLETLSWIVETCRTDRLTKAELKERYRLRYNLSEKTAGSQINAVCKYGLLREAVFGVEATEPVLRWRESQRTEFVIGAMHANAKLIGELLHEVRQPRTRSSLLQTANGTYGFELEKDSQIGTRLGWLMSAGFVNKPSNAKYQATDSGIAFLERIDVHRPDPPPLPPPPPPWEPAEAVDIEKRLRTLSRDGAKHKEFEAAVRDAFAYLGFEAKQLSGAGQTDVLIRGVRSIVASGQTAAPERHFGAVVEVKAVGKGRLTSNHVDLMTIKKHRGQHGADYALIVGPGPAGQLLDFAGGEGIGVLDSAKLADIVRAHDEMPLPVREYQRLFADAAGGPQGGEVDLRPLEDARKEHSRLRDLLRGVFRAVSEIDDSNAGTAIPAVVQFALTGQGISASLAEVESALHLLATPWFDGLDLVDEGSHRYVPTTTPHLLAQRLRWVADAFGETDDGAAAPAGSS